MGNHLHFTRLRILGFRGHALDVPLGPGVTVLSGPNRAGKTTTRDALGLVVSGAIPGADVDKDGLVRVEVLSDCAPAAGSFTIEATDNEGEVIRFRYSEGSKRGRRDVSSTLCDSKRNEDHLAAIATRYGTGGRVLGPVALDPGKLRRLDEGDLEREVLRLCGERVDEWTEERVVTELAERTFGALSATQRELLAEMDIAWRSVAGPTSVKLLDAPSLAAALRMWPTEVPTGDGVELVAVERYSDPRALLGVLVPAIGTHLTEARSDVLAAGRDLKVDMPDAPLPSEVVELRATGDAARRTLEDLQEHLGRLRGRAEEQATHAGRESVRRAEQLRQLRADVSEREGAVAGMERSLATDAERRAWVLTEVTTADAGATAAEGALQAKTAEAAALVDPDRGDVEAQQGALVAAVEQAQAQATTAAEARAEAAAVEAPVLPDDLTARETGAREAIAAIDKDIAALNERKGELRAQTEQLRQRRERHASGECPECGQSTEHLRASLDEDLEGLEAQAAAVGADIQAKREQRSHNEELLQSLQAIRDDHARSLTRLETARKDAADAAARAQAALADTSRRLQGAVDQAIAAHRRRRAELDRAVETARAEVKRLKDAAARGRAEVEAIDARTTAMQQTVAQAQSTLDETRARLTAAEAAQVPQGGETAAAEPPLGAEIPETEEAIAQARAALAAADEAYASAKGRLEARTEAEERRDSAEHRREQAKARAALWLEAERRLEAIERAVLQAYVAPLVEPVNALLDAAGLLGDYGRLEAVFGRRFQLGFRTERGFAPLSQLSAGHFAVAVALIVTTAHMLAGSAYRAVQIDNAEAVDGETREAFLGVLTWLCAQGHLDQVVLGAVDVFGHDEEGHMKLLWPNLDGVSYRDLQACVVRTDGSDTTITLAAAAAAAAPDEAAEAA